MVTLPFKMFLPDISLDGVDENIDNLITALTRWQPQQKGKRALVVPEKLSIEAPTYEEAASRMNALFLRNS